MFFCLVTSVGLRKFWVPMRNRTSALRCSTTEPQRLHCERGLFYFLQSSVSAKCWLMLRYLTVRLHVYGIKEPSICRTTCTLSAFIREWFVTSISDWPIEWYNSALGLSQDKGDLNENKRYQGKTKVHLCLMLDFTQVLDLSIGPRLPEYGTAHWIFFVCRGAIVDQRSLLFGHIYI